MEGNNINIPFNDQVPYRVWDWGVTKDQVAARKCYIAMLEMEDH